MVIGKFTLMTQDYTATHHDFATDLAEKILAAIERDNPKAKHSNGKVYGLECPACHKKEAWAYSDKPFAIICNRANKCGVTTPTKQIYPEFWRDLTKRYPSTPDDPKATAKAYLQSRGLKPELIEFSQGYKDGHQTLVIKQDGVTFERLIDYQDKSGKGKNRLSAYKGKVFKTNSFDKADEIFISEGIIDALSLEQSGHAAIATYSSGSVPKEWYQANKDKQFTICFDNDAAGHKGIAKTIECFHEIGITNYKVALLPHGKDANDLLITGQLEAVIEDAYWRGRLFSADSALAYYKIYYEKHEGSNRIFEFKGNTYKGIASTNKDDETVLKCFRIADCSIKLLYSVINNSDDSKQLMEHYLEIESDREGKSQLRLDAGELVKLDAFKSALQNHRQIFYGKAEDLNHVASYLFNQHPQPLKIRALNTLGYDEITGGFYYPKFAYDKSGKRIDCNSNQYFADSMVRPFCGSSDVVISRLEPIDLKQFIVDLHAAYGDKGLLALGFYVAAQFSHLVFDNYGFFPFLSVYGDPHAGKSFVTKLLNRCFFVDNEGLTMTNSNTSKGVLRRISQKSSMVCCLLEGRQKKSGNGSSSNGFEFDSILPLYNRNALYSRATTDQTNRTHDLPLKAALSFVWNHECFTLKAAKERVVSLHFSESDMNEATGIAWEKLNALSPEQLAAVGDYTLKNRSYFERELINFIKSFSDNLKTQGVKVARIADNHAVVLGGVVALLELLEVQIDYQALISYAIDRAKHKLDSAKSESNLADYFFESIADFTSVNGVTTHDGALVVHLPTALKVLQESGNGFSNKAELIGELKRHDRFIVLKNCKTLGKQMECYHFKAVQAENADNL